MTDRINISLTPLPYNKRRTSILRWTLLLYIFVAVVFAFSIELGAFLFFLFFLTILFALDYSRRLKWVRYALLSIETDNAGVRLSYYDQEELKSETISWDRFKISKGTTFTRSLKRILTVKDGDNKIASFYADCDLDNVKINELYKKFKDFKSACT
jgi:hypothetical protein